MIYVNMTDPFLSGWGLADGGNSILCIECEDTEQAFAVANNAASMGMKYVYMAIEPRRKRSPRDHRAIMAFADMGETWKRGYRRQ